jgi:betaine reductase
VRHGSKPSRDLARDEGLLQAIRAHLRPYEAAVAYPPNRAFLGALAPEALATLPKPWFAHAEGGAGRRAPFGEIMPEAEFLGFLKIADDAGLVVLDKGFAAEARQSLAAHPLIAESELGRLEGGANEGEIAALLAPAAQPAKGLPALALERADGGVIGAMRAGHEEDATLGADVLLENLACKASAALALRTLLRDEGIDPESVPYLLNSGEEAVGDRYQRGGGNLAKAIAEKAGCRRATGVDIKGFCCGPVHALAIAGSLVASRVFPRVAVVGGCSLAKLGMKYRGHLSHDQPILEDVLAGIAILVSADDGRSPRMRIDALGLHPIAAGSAQQDIFRHLVTEPLRRLGLRYADVDKYATELHNPEVTEPAGSGNVPLLNYRTIAGLAALEREIAPAEVPAFVERHGMPGFSPTQGHIASAVPYLGHALAGLTTGKLNRVMFLAKGSLFLGRMTQLSDGISILLERNG